MDNWGGRLNQITSISPRVDPEPDIELQDLRYTYDEVGNELIETYG